jgi:hypothetical protein
MADFFGKSRQVNGTFARSAQAEAPKKQFLSSNARRKRKLIALEAGRSGLNLADKELQFDKIGYWSEVKLEIIKRYGVEYSKILTATRFDHLYIDAFAGGGHHIARSTNELVLGSPLNALAIKPPFKEIFLIDLEPTKTSRLRDVIGD